MSFLKNLLLGVAGAKTYQNVYNKPIITPPPGYVIRGMKHSGIGSTWKITYSKNGSSSTNYFKINSGTKGYSMGSDKWGIDWP
jgi:hypothetical protein